METGNVSNPNGNREVNSLSRVLFKHLTDLGLAGATLAMRLKSLQATTDQLKAFEEFCEKLKAARAEDVGFLKDLKDLWNQFIQKFTIFSECKETTKILNAMDILTEHEVQEILKEVNKTILKLAENQVLIGALASGTLYAVQIHLLIKIWGAIAKAENLADDAEGLVIKTITGNMEELNALAKQLTDWISQYDKNSRSVRNQLLRNIQMKVSRMSILYNDTCTMIFELRININGEVVQLGVYQQEMTSYGIMNLANGIAQLAQMNQVSGLVSSGYMALQAGVTAIFFGLVATNIYTYRVTGKTVARLRTILTDIRELDVEIKGIQKRIRETEDFVTAIDWDDQVSVYQTFKTLVAGDTNYSKRVCWTISLIVVGLLIAIVYPML